MSALPTVEQARDRLARFQGRYPEISRVHGISYSWLTKFGQGLVVNPTLKNLQALTAALDQLESEDTPTAPAPTN